MKFLLRLICAAVIVWQVATTLPVPGPPGPVVIPDIPVVPVEEGQRTVVIIRESENDTPAFARMVNALRDGDNARYITNKGHTLMIFDQHQLDENGQPLDLVQSLLPINSNLPAIFILESSDGRPLHNQTLTTLSAAEVMSILKEHGG